MRLSKIYILYLIVLATISLPSCRTNAMWEGQEAIQKVSTETVPIQKQQRQTYALPNGIYLSNDFDGARLNEIVSDKDDLITVLITPENTPINDSPWYAFSIWSETSKEVKVKLTYQDANHRYYPKLSVDGINWEDLDSANYSEELVRNEKNDRPFPESITMQLSIGPDTLWIAAQELITSTHNNAWIEKIDEYAFATKSKLGESREGRDINMLKIGNSDDQKMVIVISRQHPPEVTGYIAMQSFVETLCADTEIAKQFREEYNVYVIPMLNPDGVNEGHWRHSSAGIDMNRDWQDFNQVETQLVRDFLKNKTDHTNGNIYFGVDFHSTYEDIYYTMDPALKGNMPGLVPAIIKATAKRIPGYDANISPRPGEEAPVTSLAYLFHEYGTESLVYEIGDNTPRDLVRQKGQISAEEMMRLMLE